MRAAFICDAVRTPIGRHGGALSAVRADDLAAMPIRALLDRNPGLDPAQVDEVILGAANQAGEDNRNVARMASLLAGLPASVPGVTVNRLCASGLEAIGQAARAIMTGEADLVIAGGSESMSRAPYVLAKAERGFARDQTLFDTTIGWRFVNRRLAQAWGVDSMAQTAENVAADRGISREAQDAYALRSQERAERARTRGFLADEIVPVAVRDGKGGATMVAEDEHPRPGTTAEKLATLEPVVRADGTVTAGNSSGINDGGAAMILASEAAVARHQLAPRARILGMASAGVPPRVMGIGPVPAIERLLARIGGDIGQFASIEINEAFAAQAVAVLRGLGLADDAPHVNPNGGAIALGHPLGMSGARLVQTAVHQLQAAGGQRALVALCVGVGQGLAMALERA